LQIATIGKESESVMIGIRNFPVHKLALICQENDIDSVKNTSIELKQVLKLPVDIYPLKGDIIKNLLTVTSEILRKESEEFKNIIMNVAGGDKLLTCAAVSAAFVNGLKAFHIMEDMPVLLPVLKLSYSEIISATKIDILKSIDKVGGKVKSLEHLSEISGYGKPLLSHHIQGSEDSRGLAELGLVETNRVKRGRLEIELSTLGKVLLTTKPR